MMLPAVLTLAARVGATVLVACLCALTGTTSLTFIVAQFGAPYPVKTSWKTEVASIGIDRLGRITISVTPWLVHTSEADLLAFLYLHEVGHAREGHLRPRHPGQRRYFMPWEFRDRYWRMEYEADAWATKAALARGYDPGRGVEQLFRRFGDGGGLTHPPDRVRIDRVRRLAALWP